MKRCAKSPILESNTWVGKVHRKWTPARGGVAADLEPTTGEVLADVGDANAEDVAAPCSAAAEAQRDWARRSHGQRAQILIDAAAQIRENYDELIEWIMRECGGVRARPTSSCRTPFSASATSPR